MYNIRVNGTILEIPPESIFVLNSLVLNFNVITARGVTSSNTFKAPLTRINQEALEFPDPINSTSEAWTKLFPAEIMLGKNVLSAGSVRIKEVNNREVSLQYQDRARDFYDNLNRKAEDIDFSDFDLVFTDATFTTIANITAGQIWAYKNLQCAIEGFSAVEFIVFTRPCYSVRELLKKFIEVVGFQVDFANIDEVTDIDSLLLTSHGDNFIVSDFRQQYIEESFSGTSDLPIDTNDFALISTVLSMDTIKNTSFPYSLNIKGTIISEGSGSIKITNSVAAIETITLNSGANFVNFTSSLYEIDSISSIEVVGEVIFQDVFLYLILDEKNMADALFGWATAGVSILTNYFFLGAHNLPNITQLDLLRAVWSLYFIKTDINIFERTVNLRLFGQASELSAIDITDNITAPGKVSATKIFARQNIFSYSNDADTFPDYAQFIFRASGNNNQPIKDYIKFPFGASVNKQYIPLGNMARVEVYSRTFTFGSVGESRVELTNRLLLENGDNAVFENLSWGSLFERYYTTLFSRITQKRLKLNVIITYDVFKQLTDIGFVFIRNQGLFFIENIQAFAVGRPTGISLLYLR